jgi:small conductance mechanosensitive channel
MDWLTTNLNIAELTTLVVQYIPKMFAAALILLVFWVLYRVTRVPIAKALEQTGLHPALVSSLVDSIYRLTIIVFALVMAAGQLGINVAAALAGIGVAGVAIGFAAQDSIANVISGFTIFIDKPFEVGDWVNVAGQDGEVSGITLRSTRIRTVNNTYVVIPNKTIIDEVLVNHSKHGAIRVDVPIGIAYKEYIPKAREVLLKAMEDVAGIQRDPAPAVVVTDLGDSSVNLEVRVWVEEGSQQAPVTSTVVEAGKMALDVAGIEIPFPHLQLFVDNVTDAVWNKAALLPTLAGQRTDRPS